MQTPNLPTTLGDMTCHLWHHLPTKKYPDHPPFTVVIRGTVVVFGVEYDLQGEINYKNGAWAWNRESNLLSRTDGNWKAYSRPAHEKVRKILMDAWTNFVNPEMMKQATREAQQNRLNEINEEMNQLIEKLASLKVEQSDMTKALNN